MRFSLASAAALSAAAFVSAGACADAEPTPIPTGPSETAPPQQATSCAQGLAGALTPTGSAQTGNNLHLLQCSDGIWQPFADPYPSSDRWLTTGGELVLHGQGRRNPEAKAGTWTASPQTSEARCSAESVDVIGAGRTSAPQTYSSDAGRSLTFEVSDHMFTVKLSGYCLWQRG